MKFIFCHKTIVSLENIRTVAIVSSESIRVTYKDTPKLAYVPTEDATATLQEIAKILEEKA